MNPLTLNLLSASRRKTTHYVRLSRTFLASLLLALITYGAILGILMGGNVFLEREKKQVEQELAQNEKILRELEASNAEAKSIRGELTAIKKNQKDYRVWSEALRELSSFDTQGIRLTEMSFQSADSSYRIRGIAATRESLAEYQQTLEDTDRIQTVESPVSSFTQRENIPFQLTGTFLPPLFSR
ncbi:MAG: hypothetical protein HYV34_02735 [Candidatus Kerfeldbacteria bacterium]|nr:hypothetical protein [Candidatus Kerfeldbacteria bacterium]